MATSAQAPRETGAAFSIRFPCSNCGAKIRVSPKMLLQLRRVGGACRQCSAKLKCPPLDRTIEGADVILQALGTCAVECPGCHRKLEARIDSLGRRRRCPGCNRRLQLRFVADETSAAPGAVRAAAAHRKREPAAAAVGDGDPQTSRSAAPSPAESSPRPEPEIEVVEPDASSPEPIVYGATTSGNGRGFQAPLSESFALPPRAASWLVWGVIQFGLPFALAILLGQRGLSEEVVFPAGLLFLALIIPRFRLAGRLSDLIVPFLVPTFRCPHCFEEYEAVSRWGCSCGFVDHRERHILRFKCPKCRNVLGYTNCERCDATIMLR